MNILAQVCGFEEKYGRSLSLDGCDWRYYRLGRGKPILWLTGGLRRAALGYSFFSLCAKHHTLIAPDYSPLTRWEEFLSAFDAILVKKR